MRENPLPRIVRVFKEQLPLRSGMKARNRWIGFYPGWIKAQYSRWNYKQSNT
jgi:hypothetical protein